MNEKNINEKVNRHIKNMSYISFIKNNQDDIKKLYENCDIKNILGINYKKFSIIIFLSSYNNYM